MKRTYSLFSLMAVTALSLSLGACDDKKDETAAMPEAQATAEQTAATEQAAAAMPAAVIHVEGATAFATAPDATTGAVFLTLHNPQAAPDRLIGASTPAAAGAELHESTTVDGVMQMKKVDAIEIQPGQQVSLKADGYHIMLTGLTAPLAEGTPFDITLDFETAADVTIPVTVTAPAAPAADAAPTMDHSAHEMPAADAAPATDTAATPSADESPAPADGTATPDVAAPAPETTTPAPAAPAPATDEKPAQ